MALPVRKGYKGAPAKAVLTSGVNDSDTSFVVDTVTGWATTFPFYCVVEPGTSKEEKIKVTAISTLTLTVVRAQDDTSAQSHSDSAAIYPVFTADEADEANEIASVMTTKGDLIATNGSSINRLNVGTNTHVLQADSTATNGFKWGQVATAGIADSAVTSAKIADNTIVDADVNSAAAIALSKLATGALPTAITVASANLVDGTIVDADVNASAAIALSKLATGALPTSITVASANLVDGTIALADLATAVANALVPVGTIAMYGGAAAPTGWLLCDGTSTTGYTALAAIVGATTPDFKGRFALGDNSTLTLLGTGGSTTIGTTNLPAHSHAFGTLATVANSTGVSTTNNNTSQHVHAITTDLLTSTTAHGHGQTGQFMGGTSATPEGTSTFNIGTDGNHIHDITDPTHSHTISGDTANTGGAQAYYQPYLVVNYIIKHD